MAEFFDWVMIA